MLLSLELRSDEAMRKNVKRSSVYRQTTSAIIRISYNIDFGQNSDKINGNNATYTLLLEKLFSSKKSQ